jgi:hypothetical protein
MAYLEEQLKKHDRLPEPHEDVFADESIQMFTNMHVLRNIGSERVDEAVDDLEIQHRGRGRLEFNI